MNDLDTIYNSINQSNGNGKSNSLDDIYNSMSQVTPPKPGIQQNLITDQNGDAFGNLLKGHPLLQTVANGARDLAGSIINPYSKIAVSVIDPVVNYAQNKGTEIYNQNHPDQQIQPLEYQMPNPISGKVAPQISSWKDLLGTTGEAALNVSPIGEGKAVVGLLPNTIKYGKNIGGFMGASEGLQALQDNKSVTDIAKDTGKGLLEGTAIGVGLGPLAFIGGKYLGGKYETAMNNFRDAVDSGDAQAVTTALDHPDMQKYLKDTGMGSPQETEATLAKLTNKIKESVGESNRVALQPYVDQQDFPDTVRTVLENAKGVKVQGNKANWDGTVNNIQDKISGIGTILKDVSKEANSQGIDAMFGITPEELIARSKANIPVSKLGSKLTINDQEQAKRILENELLQRKFTDLGDILDVRAKGNSAYEKNSTKGIALDSTANAVRSALSDRIADPTKYGLRPEAVTLLKDIESMYDEYIKLYKAKDFLNVWKYEPVVKANVLMNKLAGAIGFMSTGGNFLGMMGAHALTDKLQSSYMKNVIMKMYANPSAKLLERTPENMRAGIMKSLDKLGSRQRAIAQAKINMAPVAEKPSMYEPYANTLPTIQVGKGNAPLSAKAGRQAVNDSKLPSIDYGANDAASEANYIKENAYIPDSQLPSIDMGPTAKSKYQKNLPPDDKLPIIRSLAWLGITGAAVSGIEQTDAAELPTQDAKERAQLDNGAVTRLGVSHVTSKPIVTIDKTNPISHAYDQELATAEALVEQKLGVKLPKGYLKTILAQESTFGTNSKKYDKSLGENAWLMGITAPAIHEINSRMKGEYALDPTITDTDTVQGAINAAALYSALKLRKSIGLDKQGNRIIDMAEQAAMLKDPTLLYKVYNGKGTPGAEQDFKQRLNYYKSDTVPSTASTTQSTQ